MLADRGTVMPQRILANTNIHDIWIRIDVCVCTQISALVNADYFLRDMRCLVRSEAFVGKAGNCYCRTPFDFMTIFSKSV